MADKKWYLVTYDIRDPRRLRHTAKIIKGYGTRLQYSVFRCRLSTREMEEMRWELSKLLAPEDDLLVIGICSHCASHILSKGYEEDWLEEVTTFDVIG